MEDDSAFAYRQKKPASSMVLDLLFSHVGLFFIVVMYTTIGAMAFVSLEGDHEERQYEKKQASALSVNQTINYLSQKFWYYQAQVNWTLTMYQEKVMDDLQVLENSIMKQMENNNYDGSVMGWDYSWTFSKSLLLTMTIITTIGYGHISPSTFYGQMFCIVYALVGCPLLLLFLANVGDAMASTLIFIYSRCCCRWCRSTRNLSELPAGAGKRQLRLLIDDDVGREDYMPTAKVNVPITIGLVLLASYIVFGAVLFVQWEKWQFHSACYFTFITISTIGYGDYYPKAAMVEDFRDNFGETMKMFFVCLYLLLGMALLSMAINLMQDQLMDKCRWLAREIGITKDPAVVEAEKIKKDKVEAKAKKGKKKNKAKKDKNEDPENPKPADEDAAIVAAQSKRRESVDQSSVPEGGLTPSAAPTRPVSAMSVLPGMPEE